MNQITIENVDDHIVQGLKQIAWRRGVPFDESIRRLLSDAVEGADGRFRPHHLHAAGIEARLPVETD